MTAKEYLRQLWQLDREIEIKYQELEQVRSGIGIRAQPDPNENVGHSGNTSDPVADAAVKIATMEQQLNRKIDRLITLRQTITEQIDGLDNRTYRNILTCRYVLMQTWDQVAESVGYNERQCYRIHGRALQEFSRRYLKRCQ